MTISRILRVPGRLTAQLPLAAALVAGGALLTGCEKRGEPTPNRPATSAPSSPSPGDSMGSGPPPASPASTP